MTPQTLADVLHPVTSAEFLTEYLHRNYLYVPGPAGKFRPLLPWRRLNELLQNLRPYPARLHLAVDGEYLPDREFWRLSRERRGAGGGRLDTARLNRHLRRGASMIIDAIDQLVEPIGTLVNDLEREFHEYIQANAYATFGPSRGFGLHQDSHDVLVLQIAGRKTWRIHGPTAHPELAGAARAPSEPLWEGALEDGDCLYLPRGWWHAVVADVEPSLHLTFGITNRTGVHLLSWLSARLARLDVFQEDLPRLADAEARRAHAERLREALFAEWTPDLIERFARDYDTREQPAHRLSLPWSAQKTPLPPEGDQARLALNLSPSAALTVLASRLQIQLQDVDRSWQFPLAMEPIVRKLLDRQAHSIQELCQTAPAQKPAVCRSFLTLLIVEGVVSVDVADRDYADE